MAFANYDPKNLRQIGWQGTLPEGLVARVVVRHRNAYAVHDGNKVCIAEAAGKFLRRRLAPQERPTVGDFVHVRTGAVTEIEAVLPRRNSLLRMASGEKLSRQVIATNIDYVFIVTGLDADFSAARIERYLSLVETCHAKPVVLLSKQDCHTDAAIRATKLQQRLGTQIPVYTINAHSQASCAKLHAYLQSGDSAVLVGSSGAGKSTLTNTLMGSRQMQTGKLSQASGRGRHTTTYRALLKVPTGGCLIDTPGMREIKLVDEASLAAFGDIEKLAQSCRFNDCKHEQEPGCAVLEAVSTGALAAQRLHNYHKIQQEQDARHQQQDRQRWRRGEGSKPQKRTSKT